MTQTEVDKKTIEIAIGRLPKWVTKVLVIAAPKSIRQQATSVLKVAEDIDRRMEDYYNEL
jgi:molybdopterin-guanine dinucleotide biosynthesis protein A